MNLAFFCLISYAYAIDAKSSMFTMDLITLMNGGGAASSASYGMNFSGIGDPVITVEKLSSANFSSYTGQTKILYLLLKTEEIKVISDLKALTDVLGSSIPEATWQRDNDPYFYWTILANPESLISGFSISLDIAPEHSINATEPHYQFSEDSIASGQHTCYVLPLIAPNDWDEDSLLKFDLWVDIEPPLISNIRPLSGAVTQDSFIDISSILYDADSGLDLSLTTLTVNNSNIPFSYNAQEQVIKAELSWPLPEGKNTIFIKAYDLLGNNVVKGWDFIVDTAGPEGSVQINNNEDVTHSAYVFLNIESADSISGVKNIYISNDGVFDAELAHPYAYSPVISNWMLLEPDVEGLKTVYVKFEDEVGNFSAIYKDGINLTLFSPDTRIISGPLNITDSKDAHFKFEASKSGCVFSYKVDELEWSGWSDSAEASLSGLSETNHYFYVKSAFDLNDDGEITVDEEDPTPALWVWTVQPAGYLEKLKEKILFWRR